MLPPVRCFTCGKVVCMYHDKYRQLLQQGVPAKEALDSFGLRRYCCRTSVLAALDLSDMYLLRYRPPQTTERVTAVISGL
jgi:DNA-directed RNA polymerase I, II, and III subunit RPABC5